MDLETIAGPQANGDAPVSIREQLLAQLEELVDAAARRREELQNELAELNAEARKYEKALAALTTEQGKPGPTSKQSRTPRPEGFRTAGGSIGPERLAETEAGIRQFAADHDEFRQVDVRGITGRKSSETAVAFEVLRQQGVIRLARREGNNKWFRLTESARRDEA